MQTFFRPEDILTQSNMHSRYWHVLELWTDHGPIYVHDTGLPASLLPKQGEKLGLLESIPLTDNSISLVGELKTTSDLTVVCGNPGNAWGKLLYRTRLLRHAAAVVSRVYEGLVDWDYRHQIHIGHVTSVVLGNSRVQLNIQV